MLTSDQERAIALMSAGMRASMVAEAIGVSDRSIRNWRSNPEFAAELEQAQEHVRAAARVRIVGLVDEAIDTVQEVMRDTGAAPAARLQAAKTILERIGLDDVKVTPAADPADINKVLAFLRWEAEQSNKAAQPRSEGNDGNPTGTGD